MRLDAGSTLTLDPPPVHRILKSPQEWQTTVGLPFVRIEGARQPSHASSRPARHTLVDRG